VSLSLLSLVWPYSRLLWCLSLSGEMLTCHECYKIALFCGLSPPLDKSRTMVTVRDTAWDAEEEVLIGLLMLNLITEVWKQVENMTTYPTVFDKYTCLDTLFGSMGAMATFNLWHTLVNTRIQEGSPFQPQFQTILDTRNTLSENGMSVNDIVTFRLGLVVHCKRLIRTTIGTVLVHTVILPSRLLSHRCHVVCPVMCRSCVMLCSSLMFHGLLILVSVY
jgi:hypothetical protein